MITEAKNTIRYHFVIKKSGRVIDDSVGRIGVEGRYYAQGEVVFADATPVKFKGGKKGQLILRGLHDHNGNGLGKSDHIPVSDATVPVRHEVYYVNDMHEIVENPELEN